MNCKRIVSLFLSAAFIFSLSFFVQAEGPNASLYVDDRAGILEEEEEAALSAMARDAFLRVNCGIYVLTVENYLDLGYSQDMHIEKILSSYYLDQGYGSGENRDGVILMLSMENRKFSL